ncbi:hypothetical protein [Loktanella sp. R86503]|uniref:hypothetical protein n=1 Tax=Loktanella sp. R86503 TaxID=3093847 RepID=UPI0036D8E63B
MTRKDALIALRDNVQAGRMDDTSAFHDVSQQVWLHDAFHGYLDAAKQFHDAVLPGWWFQIGTCCVSDDARVAPDYNDKTHRARLIKQFPAIIDGEEWDSITDIDQRPAGNLARALLLADLTALIWIEEVNADLGSDRSQWMQP